MNKLPISTHKSVAQIFLKWRVFFLFISLRFFFFNLRWDLLNVQNMRLDFLGQIQIIPRQREGTPHTTINEDNTSSLRMTYIQKVQSPCRVWMFAHRLPNSWRQFARMRENMITAFLINTFQSCTCAPPVVEAFKQFVERRLQLIIII